MGWDPVGFRLRWPPWSLAAVGRKFCLFPVCLRPRPDGWRSLSKGPDNLCPHSRQKTRGRERCLWFQVGIETEGETHVVLLVTHSTYVQADTGPVKTTKTPVCEAGSDAWLMGPVPMFCPLSPPFYDSKTQNSSTEHSDRKNPVTIPGRYKPESQYSKD